jgi:hypothetical protein
MRKNPHAVALGRKGGKVGGKARWKDVPAEERSALMRRAVETRWENARKKAKRR